MARERLPTPALKQYAIITSNEAIAAEVLAYKLFCKAFDLLDGPVKLESGRNEKSEDLFAVHKCFQIETSNARSTHPT